MLTRLAHDAGARVIAISRRAFALDVARTHGADETIVMDEHARIVAEVKRLTEGRCCERVIEAVGCRGLSISPRELVAERGRLVIAGYHQDGPRQVDMQLWNWRGIDVVNAHERDPARYVEGMRQGGGADRGGSPRSRAALHPPVRGSTSSVVALELARRRPEGFMKALVTT